MSTRRGFTLTETVVAIGLVSATLTAVAVATAGMYRACRHVRQESAVGLELGRLASQLRADAHGALSVEVQSADDAEGDAGALLLTLPDGGSVRYTLRTGHVDRVLRRGDEVPHRETYRLPPALVARWQIERGRTVPLVSLLLEPGPVGTSGPLGRQPVRVDAAVGLLRLPAEKET